MGVKVTKLFGDDVNKVGPERDYWCHDCQGRLAFSN